jgi:hypothetical protein
MLVCLLEPSVGFTWNDALHGSEHVRGRQDVPPNDASHLDSLYGWPCVVASAKTLLA